MTQYVKFLKNVIKLFKVHMDILSKVLNAAETSLIFSLKDHTYNSLSSIYLLYDTSMKYNTKI